MADGNPFATTAPNPFVSFLTGFNSAGSGNQGTQGTQSTTGQPGSQQGLIGQVVAALMKRAQRSPGVVTAPGPGTYEGNIPTQANPYSGGGQYGMPGGGDPWGQGTTPVPYADPTMQALFSQPPTSTS